MFARGAPDTSPPDALLVEDVTVLELSGGIGVPSVKLSALGPAFMVGVGFTGEKVAEVLGVDIAGVEVVCQS